MHRATDHVHPRVPETSQSLLPEPVRRRNRAVRLTVAASVGAKCVSVLCTLAQVPLALRALGTEAYGLWITLFSVIAMLNLIDFGLGVTMQKTMAEAFGRDDPARMQQTFLTGAVALGLLGLGVLFLGLPAALWTDWSGSLHIGDASLRSQSGPALALTLGAFALSLPLNAASRLAAAAQRGWLHAGWIAAGSAGTLVVVALATWGRWGFLPFVAVTTLMPVAQGLGLTIHLWRSLGWSRQDASLLPRAEWRARLGESLSFAAPQLALAGAQAAPPLALMLAAGPTAAAAFNVMQRLFSPVAQGQIMFLTPLWPAFTEAQARGDRAWVRRAFRHSLVVTLAGVVAVAVITSQAETLLGWWLGAEAARPGRALAWLIAAWTIVQLAWQPPFYLLVGVGRSRATTFWGTLGPGLAVAAMFASVGIGFGPTGVLVGATAGLLLTGLPGLAWAAHRTLHPLGEAGHAP